MSEDQKRIIREQLQANARMVRLNAERGAVYAHGQGPVNERVEQAGSYLKDMDQRSGSDAGGAMKPAKTHKR